MNEVFVLTEPPTPDPVRVRNVKGLLSATVHLSEHEGKTLCGIVGELTPALHELQWWRAAEPTCRKCCTAVDSKARIKREIR
jgi:hypothetical protein